MEKILCSACLLGIKCRYDGKSNYNNKVIKLSKKYHLIPVCPEQLGGLSTPRDPSAQKDNRVFTKSGKDVTINFQRGANQVLQIADVLKVKKAILKQRSPSCGSGQIYASDFSNKIIEGDGITTALLKKNKIKIYSEEEIKDKKLAYIEKEK